jgi:hypothetical protein
VSRARDGARGSFDSGLAGGHHDARGGKRPGRAAPGDDALDVTPNKTLGYSIREPRLRNASKSAIVSANQGRGMPIGKHLGSERAAAGQLHARAILQISTLEVRKTRAQVRSPAGTHACAREGAGGSSFLEGSPATGRGEKSMTAERAGVSHARLIAKSSRTRRFFWRPENV